MNFFKNETFKTIFEYCESFVSSVSTSYYDIYYRVIFGIWRKIEVKLKICIALVHPLVKKHIHLSVSIILCCFSKNQRKLHAGNWTSFVCCQSSQCLQKFKKSHSSLLWSSSVKWLLWKHFPTFRIFARQKINFYCL